MAIKPVNDKITYKYGVKSSAYRLGYHPGTDYASSVGTAVRATTNGSVKYLPGNNGGYGNVATLTLSNGDVIWHAHLSKKGKVGTVKTGDVIGYTGNTGWSTGPHLHVERRIGGNQDRPTDFEKWLKANPEVVPAKRVSRRGTATVTTNRLNVRNSPSTKSKVVATYGKGQTFNYDSYIVTNGYTWLSYKSWYGTRRYVAQGNSKETYVKGGR